MFVGYSEQSKSYRIHIPGFHQIELSKYVTFDEDTTFKKSKKDKEDEEEHETPRVEEGTKLDNNEKQEQVPEDHDIIEPHRPEEFPCEMIS